MPIDTQIESRYIAPMSNEATNGENNMATTYIVNGPARRFECGDFESLCAVLELDFDSEEAIQLDWTLSDEHRADHGEFHIEIENR